MGSSSGIAGFGKRVFLRRPEIRAQPRATKDLEDSERFPTPEAIHVKLIAFVMTSCCLLDQVALGESENKRGDRRGPYGQRENPVIQSPKNVDLQPAGADVSRASIRRSTAA
ncbi:hypothetical protein L596_011326 [Steinernema carpocapsae]|uniref:Uncharacterized protein n=1 Tax=Steinernema carpocapsae TaxID=34508 RepID=A0A4U5NTI2_STECR|nr:hypothetical protein L596_011326 [Steinernema carpocapsae]